MARITQKYIENQVDRVARSLKLRSGYPERTDKGAKYPYRDSCIYLSGANGRHSLEIHSRTGMEWGSPWFTKPEMDVYLNGLLDMDRVRQLKKDRKY